MEKYERDTELSASEGKLKLKTDPVPRKLYYQQAIALRDIIKKQKESYSEPHVEF